MFFRASLLILCALLSPLVHSQNRVLVLDGDGDYVTLPTSPSLGSTISGAVTIESKFLFHELRHQCLISSGNQNGYTLSITPNGVGTVRLNGVSVQGGELRTSRRFSSGQWYHLAFTYDGSQARFYVNGALDTTISANGTVVTNTLFFPSIGSEYDNGSYGAFFGGYLDEVRIWNITRTQEQIRSNICSSLAPGGRSGLQGYWRFELSYADSSGNANSGSAEGNSILELRTTEECSTFMLTMPNGGEFFRISTTQDIRWTVPPSVNRLDLFVTNDDGQTWQVIATGVSALTDRYSWVIPSAQSQRCKVKICNSDDPSQFDISDQSFLILPSGGGGGCGNISAALVFDGSGSMSGSGNAGAKLGGLTFISRMDGLRDQAAILVFTSSVTILQGMTSSKTALEQAVQSLPASGATAVWDGIYAGIIEVGTNASNPQRVVIVMTDGGDNSSTRKPSDIISLALQRGVAVYTIGLGSAINAIELQSIADQTGGRYFQTTDANELPAVYTIIIDEVKSCPRIIAPNGGEFYLVGTQVDLEWRHDATSALNIELTTDDGASWQRVAISVPASSGRYSWTVPDLPSSQCRIRITDDNNPSLSDISDATFSIARVSIGGCGNRSVSILVDASSAMSGKWNPAVIQFASGFVTQMDEGSDEAAVLFFSEHVRLVQRMTSDVQDLLSAIGTLTPSGSGRLYDGILASVEHAISDGINSNRAVLVVNASKDFGSTHAPSEIIALARQYSVPIFSVSLLPSSSIEADVLKRLAVETGGAYFQTADAASLDNVLLALGSLVNQCIELLSPQGGEKFLAGSQHEITWRESSGGGAVRIELSTDNGSTWMTIANRIAPGTERMIWTVPHTPSPQCFIRVIDENDPSRTDRNNSPFAIVSSKSLTLISPVGGEVLSAGSAHSIRWSALDVAGVRIEFSLDNGTTWQSIVDRAPNTGMYVWVVPGTPTLGGRMRLIDVDEPLIYDMSPGSFVIQASTDVNRPGLPATMALYQNHPNPFRPETTLRFRLSRPEIVRLIVTDLLGREIARLIDGEMLEAGDHSIAFTALGLTPGGYIYRLETAGGTQARKMLLLR